MHEFLFPLAEFRQLEKLWRKQSAASSSYLADLQEAGQFGMKAPHRRFQTSVGFPLIWLPVMFALRRDKFPGAAWCRVVAPGQVQFFRQAMQLEHPAFRRIGKVPARIRRLQSRRSASRR